MKRTKSVKYPNDMVMTFVFNIIVNKKSTLFYRIAVFVSQPSCTWISDFRLTVSIILGTFLSITRSFDSIFFVYDQVIQAYRTVRRWVSSSFRLTVIECFDKKKKVLKSTTEKTEFVLNRKIQSPCTIVPCTISINTQQRRRLSSRWAMRTSDKKTNARFAT